MSDPSSPLPRRDFLRGWLSGGVLALIATIAYPILAYLKPPKPTGEQVNSVKVGAAADFPSESGTLFRFGNKPGILVRDKQGNFRAFNATCTHLDCTVQFKKDAGIIWCACHNGQYDLAGRNIGGPPPKPLEEFQVIVKGDEVFVARS